MVEKQKDSDGQTDPDNKTLKWKSRLECHVLIDHWGLILEVVLWLVPPYLHGVFAMSMESKTHVIYSCEKPMAVGCPTATHPAIMWVVRLTWAQE